MRIENKCKGFWVYLKDGICYWFLGILGIPEQWYMLLVF